jgi:predicted nucleic acid-binding Zn ribbon protein
VPDHGQSGDKLQRARDALAAARRQARSRSRSAGPAGPAGLAGPAAAAAGGSSGQAEAGENTRGVRDGSVDRRRRNDDPQPLGTAIDSLLTERGWELAAATGSVFGRWAQIVGPDLAGHTTPESLRDGELVIAADSTAWATQLRLLAAQLVRRLNTELGDGTVLRVKVRGPVAPARKPGDWRVHGGRGPRDTYG